jgi:hypothetical protein
MDWPSGNIFIAFIGFLAGLSILLTRISGWSILATFYGLSGAFNSKCWRFHHPNLFIP